MAIKTSPVFRATAAGVVSAALLVGAFSLGVGRGGGTTPAAAATLTADPPGSGRITVTGTGTATGVPNQLVLSMTVQVNGYSVSSALTNAEQTVRQVTKALRNTGVPESEIQTSDVQIYPNYGNNSQVPTSYGVSESLSVTLNNVKQAGGQIDAAVRAGGNAVTVNDVSLNLTSTGAPLATARANAVADARAQAEQYAKALNERLGPVISITPVQEQTSPQPDVLNGQAYAKASSVPISAGTQQLTVQITVVYAV